MNKYPRRLPVSNTHNVRELGGFPAVSGKVTAYGKFIRSELIESLGGADADHLREYGVLSSMDFRSSAERARRKSAFETLPFIEYKAVPLSEQVAAMPESEYTPPADLTWDRIYIEMIEANPQWTREALAFAAECPGALIYNCRSGKDRTGIFTAYLLSIAGVPQNDIVADYCVSQVYMEPVFAAERLRRPDLPADSLLYATPPSAMIGLLDYFAVRYGGAAEFLRHCGVRDIHIEKIHEKLIG